MCSDTKQSALTFPSCDFPIARCPASEIKLEQKLRVQMIRDELRRKVGGTNKSLLCGVKVVAAKAVSRLFRFVLGGNRKPNEGNKFQFEARGGMRHVSV